MVVPRIGRIAEPRQVGISVHGRANRYREWILRSWLQNALCKLNYSKKTSVSKTKETILQMRICSSTFVLLLFTFNIIVIDSAAVYWYWQYSSILLLTVQQYIGTDSTAVYWYWQYSSILLLTVQQYISTDSTAVYCYWQYSSILLLTVQQYIATDSTAVYKYF